jgi:hypothetical protein
MHELKPKSSFVQSGQIIKSLYSIQELIINNYNKKLLFFSIKRSQQMERKKNLSFGTQSRIFVYICPVN